MIDKLLEAIRTGVFPYTLFESDSDTPFARPTGDSFAAGTQILLADGSTKAIEKLIPATKASPSQGDVLLSVDGVTRQYVVGRMSGLEKSPLVHLKVEVMAAANKGTIFETRVTEGHAILKNQTYLAEAWRFRKNDIVQTMCGPAKVISSERVYGDGCAWNLFIASKDFVENTLPNLDESKMPLFVWNSLLGLTPKQHLVVGDGIISGDWVLQDQLDSFYRNGVSLVDFA